MKDLTRSRVLSVAGLSLLGVGGIRVAVFWYQRLSDLFRALRADHLIVPPDFGMMYTAGKLVLSGAWSDVYNIRRFAEACSHVMGVLISPGGAVFPYPPPTGLALSLISRLDLQDAIGIWVFLTLACLAVGARLTTRHWGMFPLLLLTMPVLLAFRLGQNSPVSLLLLGTALALFRKGRRFAAGACLGLLVLKPQLLIGLVLWWLSSPKLRSREAAGALLTSGSVLIASSIAAPGGWRVYFSSLSELASPPGMVPLGSFSLLDFARFLLGEGPNSVALTIVGTVAMAMALLALLRRYRNDRQIGFAIAVVASVLLSPHMVSYDWLILLIPGAILWERSPALRPELTFAAAILNIAAMVSAELVHRSLSSFGWAFSPAFPLLVVVTAWLAFRLESLRRDTCSRRAALA